jgi:hypothetical protein
VKTIVHPRLGEYEQIDESPLFIRITYPQHNYDFWILKTELEIDMKKAPAKRAQKYTPEQKLARKEAAKKRRPVTRHAMARGSGGRSGWRKTPASDPKSARGLN